MSATILLFNPLALLSALLLLIGLIAAYLLRRRSLALRALANQAALDRADDGLIAVDRAGKIIQHNSAAARLAALEGPGAGRPLAEATGDRALGAALRGWLAAGAQPVERTFTTQASRPQHIQVTATPLGGAQGTLLALRDVTQQQLATEQLARRAIHLAALRRVAEALGSARASYELLTTIADVARDALTVAHVSIGQIDEARGQLTIVAGSAASAGGDLIGLALPLSGGPGGRPWQLDAPIEIADPRHDQRLATLHDLLESRDAGALLIVPLRAGGQLLGTLNLAGARARHFDDADLDLAQALAGYAATALANQRLIEAAHQAERAKSAILDAVSHEFRTPLTAILGFTELYQESVLGPVTEEQQEALEAIHRNGHRLLKLVDDLLDLARLEAGRLDMSLYPVEVGLCITEAAGLLAAQFKQKQLDLRLEIAEQLPPAWADAMWLRRVLVNLLANALRYTSAGAITVRAFETTPQHGRAADARRLVIEVEDTGRGIPEAEQQLIFDAFQRADGAQATFPTSSGSGLGLTISKRAIDQMDGQLALRSQPDHGSTFTIALHAAELAIEHPHS